MAGRGRITGEVWQIPSVVYELVERRRCLEDITGGVGASPSWIYLSLRHSTTNIRRKGLLVVGRDTRKKLVQRSHCRSNTLVHQ
jgi:hypothetical protein